VNLTRLRRGLSRGAAAGCSQGREPLETVINDHKAPEGRQVLCVPVAPPGLLAAAGPTTRGSRPWLHSIVPTGLAQTSQFRQLNKFLLDQVIEPNHIIESFNDQEALTGDRLAVPRSWTVSQPCMSVSRFPGKPHW
jgi:hypothetical protein